MNDKVQDTQWSLVALVAAIVTSVVIALAPLDRSTSCRTTSTGQACTTTSESLVESEGRRVLVVLAVPVAITLVPVLWRSRIAAYVAAVLLTVAVFLGAASIGLFYVPTVVLAWKAAIG